MTIAAIHPGEQLTQELGELRISATELARQLHVPTNRIMQILNGRRAITGDTALRLPHFFGTSAEFGLTYKTFTKSGRPSRRPANPSRHYPLSKNLASLAGAKCAAHPLVASISSCTNSPAAVEGDLPSRRSSLAFSTVDLSGISRSFLGSCPLQIRLIEGRRRAWV